MSPGLAELDKRERSRLLARVVGRCVLTTVVAFVVYAYLPIRGIDELGVALQLFVCVVAFFGVAGWQARAIVVADRPQLRAVEAVVTAIVVLIVMFGYAYLLLSAADAGNFSEPLNRPDGVYFAVTVLATVGFGDIAPVSTSARMAVMVQMVLDLVVIGVVVCVFFGAAKRGMAKKSSTDEETKEVPEPSPSSAGFGEVATDDGHTL